MKKLNTHKFIGFALCLLLFMGLVTPQLFQSKGAVQHVTPPRVGQTTLTLFQAMAVAEKEAQATDSGAKLVKVISVDAVSPKDPQKTRETLSSGEDGLRGTWNFLFTNCTLTLSDGKIVEKNLTTSFNERRPFTLKNLKLNSSDALLIAKKQKKLRPGNPSVDWVVGYNFNLEYTSFIKNLGQEYLIIEVIGISPKGNFARVDLDATTGKIILAEEKTYDANENPVWNPF